MTQLSFTFKKPAFAVSNVVVCPVENSRGLRLGYNVVAQGKMPSDQVVLTMFGSDADRNTIGAEVAELKTRLELVH